MGYLIAAKRLPKWVGQLYPVACETSKPGLYVLCDRGVDKEMARHLREIAAGIALVSPPTHRVRCIVLPSVAIDLGNGVPLAGCFLGSEDPPNEITGVNIVVATGLRKGRADRMESVLHVLGHEYAHYEQWRVLGRTTERGAEVRGRGLVRQARKILEQTRC